MFTSLLNFIRDNYQTVEAAAVALAVVFSIPWLWSRYRGRDLVSRANMLQRRKAVKAAEAAKPQPSENTLRAYGEMLREQTLRDVFRKRKFWSIYVKRQAAIEKVVARESQADVTRAGLGEEFDNFQRTLRPAADDPIAIQNRRLMAILNLALFAGDILIVSLALRVSEQAIGLYGGYLASVALAVSIWLGGKVIGDGISHFSSTKNNNAADETDLRQRGLGTTKVIIGLALLVGAALGLSLLRLMPATGTLAHDPMLSLIVWLMLSLAPGLGSTAVTVLSSNRPNKAMRAAESRWQAKSAAVQRAIARSGRASARLARLDARTAVLMMQAQLETEAVRAFYALDAPISEVMQSALEFEEALLSRPDNGMRVARPAPDLVRPESAVAESQLRTRDLIDLVEAEHVAFHPSHNGHGAQNGNNGQNGHRAQNGQPSPNGSS